MARFYVPGPQIKNGILRIEGSEVRHIRKVLRLTVGDQVTVFDGEANEYQGKIIECRPSSVTVTIHHTSALEAASLMEITLAQSLLKGEKMDYVIQKATELGVTEVIPFLSARSIPILERPKNVARRRRWEKIAVGASKQSGRRVLPNVEPIQEYLEMLRSADPGVLRLILSEREGFGLKDLLRGQDRQKGVFFVVGPEGGLSRDEIEYAKKEGFVPVRLGSRILRAETASLSLLSILQYEWGDIG